MTSRAWNSTFKRSRKPMPKVNEERLKRREEQGLVYGPYHRWVETQPCILTGHQLHECEFYLGRSGIEGHHLKTVASGGKDAGNEVSVCAKLHDLLHQHGKTWAEARYPGLSLDLEAVRLWERYLSETAEPDE